MRLAAHLTLAVLIAVAGAGCIGGGPTPRQGDALIDFPVLALDGKVARLSQVIGGRVAVFTFGATWCGPCARQLAEFNKLRAAYPRERLAVIDVDLGEPAALVKRHAAKHRVTFTTVLDPTSKAATAYGVSSIPVTLVVGRDATVVYRGGYTDAGRLKAHIDKALAAAGQP